MTARLGAAWLESRFYSGLGDDAIEDAADWLAGNDDAIAEREQARRTSAVIETGGEIG